MTLSEIGESRVRGYLYVLDKSLRSFLPRDVAADAVREVESHIRERLEQTEPIPDERVAVERVLGELGPPLARRPGVPARNDGGRGDHHRPLRADDACDLARRHDIIVGFAWGLMRLHRLDDGGVVPRDGWRSN